MSKKFRAVTANLYSVHWENDADHGYFHHRVRVLAQDARDAITATIPSTTGKVHVKSVDLLAESITLLLTDTILSESYGGIHGGGSSDEDWRKMLGASTSEVFNGYRRGEG